MREVMVQVMDAYCASVGTPPEALPGLIRGKLGEGWVGDEALAIGLFAAYRAPDIGSSLRVAANHGGDSDSTASIAGQISGAALGSPVPWGEGLDCWEELLELASRLA